MLGQVESGHSTWKLEVGTEPRGGRSPQSGPQESSARRRPAGLRHGVAETDMRYTLPLSTLLRLPCRLSAILVRSRERNQGSGWAPRQAEQQGRRGAVPQRWW